MAKGAPGVAPVPAVAEAEWLRKAMPGAEAQAGKIRELHWALWKERGDTASLRWLLWVRLGKRSVVPV